MAEFDLIRQLPHSQEAEQALLGAVLLDPEKFNEIVFLKPEYFYEEQHQQIYTAMLEMYNTNRQPRRYAHAARPVQRRQRVQVYQAAL